MIDDNRISASIPPADITTILTKIQDMIALLPFLISVSNEERQEMPKMGDKSIGFDDKCQGYMASNPEFLPGFIQIAEIVKDRNLRAQMLQFIPQMRVLMDALEDTLMVVSSEIWMADLAYYQSAREAARRNRPGAELIYNDLKSRFPGSPTPIEPPPPPPAP